VVGDAIERLGQVDKTANGRLTPVQGVDAGIDEVYQGQFSGLMFLITKLVGEEN